MPDPLDRFLELQNLTAEIDRIIMSYHQKVEFISTETARSCRIRISYAEETIEAIENNLKLYRGEYHDKKY